MVLVKSCNGSCHFVAEKLQQQRLYNKNVLIHKLRAWILCTNVVILDACVNTCIVQTCGILYDANHDITSNNKHYHVLNSSADGPVYSIVKLIITTCCNPLYLDLYIYHHSRLCNDIISTTLKNSETILIKHISNLLIVWQHYDQTDTSTP